MENESKHWDANEVPTPESVDESEVAIASLEQAFLEAMQKGDLTEEQIERAYRSAVERRDNG